MNGTLTYEEFRSLVTALRTTERHSAKLTFALFDLDGDCFIDRDEFHGMFRFFLGHEPTADQLEEEWQGLAAESQSDFSERVSLAQYSRWLERNPAHSDVFKLQPSAQSSGFFKSPSLEFQKSQQTSLTAITRLPSTHLSPNSCLSICQRSRKCKPLDLCPQWRKSFTPGLNPGHYNDTRPQGWRQYFLRSQTELELRRFFWQHHGFEKHLAGLDAPPEIYRGAALLPKCLSSEGGTPCTLPGRHGRDGTIADHITGEPTPWEDNFVTPLRYRSREIGNMPCAYYRPIAERGTFSEPDRVVVLPRKKRAKPTQKVRSHH